MKRMLASFLLLFALFAFVGIAGCEKKEEGGLEKAGKQVDEAAGEASEAAGEAAEDAGKKLDDALGN